MMFTFIIQKISGDFRCVVFNFIEIVDCASTLLYVLFIPKRMYELCTLISHGSLLLIDFNDFFSFFNRHYASVQCTFIRTQFIS